jgi:hypothetical protein
MDLAKAVGDGAAVAALADRPYTPETAAMVVAGVAGIRHTWWRPPTGRTWGDDDRMLRCNAGAEGARPFTEVEVL